jgi:filamentous hemagglutinin
VKVGGNIDLKGGAIVSTAPADNNDLTANSLTFSNIENSSRASASSYGIVLGPGGIPLPVVGQPAKQNDHGKTLATLSPGHLTLSDQRQDLASLNTDPSKANDQTKPFDIDKLQKQQQSAAALSQLLNMAVGTIAEKLRFDEGSPEKIALHAATGAIVSALSGGNIGSAALAGGAEELANGILVDVLKANPNLSDAQKLAIGEWAAAFVGAATGGTQGAAASLDNFNYNYLDHPDNDKLNVAKAACAKGDQVACATKAQLEAKDADQQKAYVDCKSGASHGDACDKVFYDAYIALSSYGGVAPIYLSQEDRDLILSDGSFKQIEAIMAPQGADKLSPEKLTELRKLEAILILDPTGTTAIPYLLDKAKNSDAAASLQLIGLFLRVGALSGLGKLDGIVNNAENNAAKTTGVSEAP